jgi:AbrB family looped-hinge helix DNA binding protein
MRSATISSKFQICVPKAIRDLLHIVPGQEFIFIAKGNCLELVPQRDIKNFRGLLAGANTSKVRDRSDRS